jgi:hypothetical protein
VGKNKLHETIVGSTPLLIYYGSSMIMTINSFQKLVVANIGYTSEEFWKTLIGISTSLLLN